MDVSGVIPLAIKRSFGSSEQVALGTNVTNLMCAGVSSSVCTGCAVTLHSSRQSAGTSGHGREVRE
ncbi:MAG: hypothetical protein NTZ39_06315 [Methanoregula sp.]|nr:hypothetical protein [Methanoregula sp.]